jgi:hypothetical protein
MRVWILERTRAGSGGFADLDAGPVTFLPGLPNETLPEPTISGL